MRRRAGRGVPAWDRIGRGSGRLVSENASAVARQWVRWNMTRLNDHGYCQAIELLCGGDLLAELPPAMSVRVVCG